MVFLAFAKCLCIHDDLMLFVHGGNTIVALDGALAGRHLGRLVVGDIAFDFLRPLTLPPPWGCCL